jgi:hypothetical protein
MIIDLSLLPEAIAPAGQIPLFGRAITHDTKCEWPCNVFDVSPVLGFQIFKEQSLDAETTIGISPICTTHKARTFALSNE